MNPSYALTTAAEADLRDIIQYTRKRWGDAQARTYAASLKTSIERVATGQGLSRDMATLHPGLRVIQCEHHYIFCLLRNAEPALVVAIFHERMDLMARLADRLR